MKRGFRRVTVARLVLGGFVSIALYAQGQVVAPPTPGVVAGGFCTYRTGFFKTSTQAAQRINRCRSTPASRRCNRLLVQVDNRARSPKAQSIRPTWARAASLALRRWR